MRKLHEIHAVNQHDPHSTTNVVGVDFVTLVFDEEENLIETIIPASAADPGTTLFSRLKDDENFVMVMSTNHSGRPTSAWCL